VAAPKKAVKTAQIAIKTNIKLRAMPKKQSKIEIIQTLSDETNLSRKEVASLLVALGSLLRRHMLKRGSGYFTIPETGVKVRRVHKAETKERQGVNPFTGQPMTIPSKPARDTIKVSALKTLKESTLH
jgi:nucleoid DNA-binding protein